MEYVEENLLQGEEVVYRPRLHIIILLAPSLVAVLGLIVFAAIAKLAALLLAIALLLTYVTGPSSTWPKPMPPSVNVSFF